MKRRKFLKSGLGVGAAYMMSTVPSNPFAISKPEEENSLEGSLSPGEVVPFEAFVLDKSLQPHSVIELCALEPKAKVILLCIYGGRVPKQDDRLGGIWCPDSFEDLHIVRYLHLKYQPEQIRIAPIACPPVYSSHYYGFEQRVFLDEPDDSKKFQDSVAAFMDNTEKLFVDGYLPVPSYYDVRHRLLFNRREDLQPGAGYGVIHAWQGRFRGNGDTQRYGTPTIWLLDATGRVLNEPFWGNFYHSDPFQVRYTISDVDRAIEQNLRS
ncbi:MAG TPA: hypothetical protein VGA99_15020 [bacterium]